MPTAVISKIEASLSCKITLDLSKRHLRTLQEAIRKKLSIKRYDETGELKLKILIDELVWQMADPADLINASITELLRLHYTLPSYSTLERLVRGERSKAHQKIYKSIENQLSDLEKSCLDAFLEVAKDENKSDFTKLKRRDVKAA